MALYTLLLTALCSISALAQSSTLTEPPTATDSPDTSKLGDVDANYKLTGFEKCSHSQKNDIKSGFSDMRIMLMGEGAIITKYPKIDWNSAVAQDFWGPKDRNRFHRQLIQENLDRLAAVTYDWSINPFARSVHVRCDDPRKSCTPSKCAAENSVMLAYTMDHEPHINFCKGYFTRPSLSDAMMRKDVNSADLYFNKASVWAHELMHVADIGHLDEGVPRFGIGDQPVRNWDARDGQLAYGALNTKWIAQDPSGIYAEAVENADNYAYFVTMNFMQKTLGYYQSDPQIQISPQSYSDLTISDVEAESETEDGAEKRCKWV